MSENAEYIARTNVLDKGWIELQESMGGDKAIVKGARICYQTEPDGADRDRRLIRRLLHSEPKHNTPFEHAVFRFGVKCPIFVARQWMRHRIASYNEKSLRYCEATPEYYVPQEKVGSPYYELQIQQAYRCYQDLLSQGWKREQARAVLPTAIYTEFIWTVNAWSLLNFIAKRTDNGAQWEIRQYAQAAHDLAALVMPITMQEWDAK